MAEVWQDRHNLVLVPEGCDEWTDVFASAQIVQKLQLVLYPHRAARYIDLLDGDVLRSSSSATSLDVTCG